MQYFLTEWSCCERPGVAKQGITRRLHVDVNIIGMTWGRKVLTSKKRVTKYYCMVAPAHFAFLNFSHKPKNYLGARDYPAQGPGFLSMDLEIPVIIANQNHSLKNQTERSK